MKHENLKVNSIKNNDIKVINMSSKSLSDAQISLLKKGLKFTPTPKKNIPDLDINIQEFCRTLRLKEYFHTDSDDILDEEQNDITCGPLLRNKSEWTPNRNRNLLLDNCIDALTKAGRNLQSAPVKPAKNNISNAENKALLELMHDLINHKRS